MTDEERKAKRAMQYKAYRATHKAQEMARQKVYRDAHKPEAAAVNKGYRATHKAQEMARQKAWRDAHPEEVRTYFAKWRKENRDKRAVIESKRRAAKYANTPLNEMLTSTEWLAILAEHNDHCHYCSKKAKLTLDHVIPLSRGGKHSKDNVVPACAHCNNSKGNKTLEKWRPFLFADAIPSSAVRRPGERHKTGDTLFP